MLKLLWHDKDGEGKSMPDPTLGIGIGAGGGVLGVAWIADRLFGRAGQMASQIAKLYEWHDVPDPDDSTQKIWWMSRKTRETLAETRELLAKLLDVAERQDRTQRELIEVAGQMRGDMATLLKWARGDTGGV